MNHHIKKILLVASILALLVSACDAQSLDAVDAAGAPGAEPPPGAQVEPRSTPTPTPEGDAGDADQVTTFESSQAHQVAPSPAEPVSGVIPEGIPSQEERNAMLDRVNLGGPVLPGGDEAVGEGPAPGTESRMGPVNPEGLPGEGVNPQGSDLSESAESFQTAQAPAGPEEPVSGVDPEGIPGGEERNAILDGVNPGGPVLPGSDEAVGKGPAPGTESDAEQRFSPGWTSKAVATVGHYLTRFVETLRTWWHEFLN